MAEEKRPNPRRSAHRLTFNDAVQVWIRRERGDLYHRIAADLDCNQGRIADVVKGRLHPGSETVARTMMGK